jgi:hypothetical protein
MNTAASGQVCVLPVYWQVYVRGGVWERSPPGAWEVAGACEAACGAVQEATGRGFVRTCQHGLTCRRLCARACTTTPPHPHTLRCEPPHMRPDARFLTSLPVCGALGADSAGLMALVRARPLFSPATPARAVPADCGIGAGGAAGCFHFYCVRGSCRGRAAQTAPRRGRQTPALP